ncbi:hypothetical protein PHYBOEH_003746 [Phytophthora boehmeriae]|uniref:Uncharacterized protein n=1 Tax=Phytophthora boehmeriae TaxID=109152 RepID=A0A8T1WPT8_9STRA|nr:hypothetical protein PHYBOEH_003746 [Phytophthora boehmeriae]
MSRPPPRFPAFVRPPPPPPRAFPRPPVYCQQPLRGFFPRFVAPRPPPPPPAVDPEKIWLQSFRQTHCSANDSCKAARKEPPLRVLRRRVLQAQALVERLKTAAVELKAVDKRLEEIGADDEQQDDNAAQQVEIARLRVKRERRVAVCEALKTELEAMNATSGLFSQQEVAELRRFSARVKKKKAYRKRVKAQRRAERSIRRAVHLHESEEMPATENTMQENDQVEIKKNVDDLADKETTIATKFEEKEAVNLSTPAPVPSLDPETLTIGALISVRRVWDSYIVYPQTPGASTIPPVRYLPQYVITIIFTTNF